MNLSVGGISYIAGTTDGKSQPNLSVEAASATEATTIWPLTGPNKYWLTAKLMEQGNLEECEKLWEDFGVLKLIPEYTTNKTLSVKKHADLADKVKSAPPPVLGVFFPHGFFLTLGTVSISNKGMSPFSSKNSATQTQQGVEGKNQSLL